VQQRGLLLPRVDRDREIGALTDTGQIRSQRGMPRRCQPAQETIPLLLAINPASI
jgi:hypothetical protein